MFQKLSGREKNFMDKGGGITIFRRSFCLIVLKKFIGEHFGVSENFFYRKFSCIRGGGGASWFCRNFLPHRTETESFVKEPFCFPEVFWYRKKLWIRGGISRFSIENLLFHSTEKLRRGTLLCSRKILVSKNVKDKRGGEYHNFPSNFFLSHSAEKFRRGIF